MYRLRSGTRTLALHRGVWAVGRLQTAGIYIDDKEVSRQHALLHVEADSIAVEDLGSRNGTLVNGAQIHGICVLRAGDLLRFGDTEFQVESEFDIDVDHGSFTPVNPVPGTYPGASRSHTEVPRSSPPPTPPPATAPGEPAHVIVAVSDIAWATSLEKAAAMHPEMNVELVPMRKLKKVLKRSDHGCLIVDVQALGKNTDKILKIWWSDAGRGPVLICGTWPEHEGVVLARQLQAQAYILVGKAPEMVIAQTRYQIQRAAQRKL